MWLMYDVENSFCGIMQEDAIEALNKDDYVFVKIPERIEDEWIDINDKEGYYKYWLPKTDMIVFGKRVKGEE